MKTATVGSIRISVLLLLVLQSIPIKAMHAGIAFALPEAKAGTAYEFTIRTEGGQPPFKWSVVEGNLPPGVELQQSGMLRGTPIVPRSQPYEFTLKVSDSSEPPQTYTQRFALVVTSAPLRIVMNQPALRIIDATLPSKTLAERATARRVGESRFDTKSRVASNKTNDGGDFNRKPATEAAIPKTSNEDSKVVKVCGKLRPASLDRILTIISSVPELRESKLMLRINGGRFSNDGTCEERGKDQYKPGTQKELEVQLLEFVLAALQYQNQNKNPHDQRQNRDDNESARNLDTSLKRIHTILNKPINDDPPGPLSATQWESEEKQLRDAVVRLKSITQEGFDRLSEGTIKKQIQFLNREVGNVQVLVKKADKVVATAFTDKDGNYIAKISKRSGDALAKAGSGDKSGNAMNYGAKKGDRGTGEAGHDKKAHANSGRSNTGNSTNGDGDNDGANAEADDSHSNNGDAENKAKDARGNNRNTNDEDANKGDSKEKGDSEYVVSTEADDYRTEGRFQVETEDIRVDIPIEDRPVSLLTRAVVGYQQAAAASSSFEQNYFFDMFIRSSFPIRQKIDPDFGERFQLWGAVRVASVPQAGTATIGDAASGTFIAQVKGLKLNEAARVFDLLSGFEVRLKGNSALLPSFASETKQKFSLSLIGSFGLVTPTTPEQSVRKFEISDELRKLFLPDQLKDKDFVAFVNNDRDRFFKQLYAGLRLQTFFFNRHNVPMQRFPAQLDVQFGLNSYVTGGRLNQGVVRLDGYYPLPYDKLKFINLFATAIIRPAHAKISTPLIVKQPTQDFEVPGPKVAIIPVSQFNRDYYKVGIGIDFMSLVQKITRK